MKYQQNQQEVLIVPLWNWNLRYDGRWREIYGSNRTFMELKYELLKDLWHPASGSNRTFMELKLIDQ